MMMQNENNVVKEIYFLKVKVDNTLTYEDNFSEKSVEVFEELKELMEEKAV